jgi:hypothetical protein
VNKNIEHYLFHKENFLDEKYCENCIDELDKCNWKKHEWYNSKTDSNNTLIYNTHKSGDKEPEVLHIEIFSNNVNTINDFIIQNLHSAILEYIESFKYDWFTGWAGYSAIKFLRYFPDQTMYNHCDHIQSLFDGEKKGIPILSIIGILNDDYEGGELIMFEDKKIDTKKGDLLIFPSNFLYPHEITPVTKGVRYSYVSWVW